jgi:hypothetical protein
MARRVFRLTLSHHLMREGLLSDGLDAPLAQSLFAQISTDRTVISTLIE